MSRSILTSLVIVAALQQVAATTVQKTSGWCSPNIANVLGNVTVNCIGVDPRALKRLNERLIEMKLDRDKAVQVADEWTTKYKELETQLRAAGDDGVLSRQAEEYLRQGELEKAEATLKQLVSSGKKTVDAVASHNYQLALVLELQFRPVEALPYLEEAYQLRPKELKYGQEYGWVLLDQKDYTHAEPVLLATLDNARQLAKADPTTYQPQVAAALNNLADLYTHTRRLKEAEAAYREALDFYLQLAKTNPDAQADVAMTLNNFAILHGLTGHIAKSQAEYQESLNTYRELAKTNPTYLADFATTLSNSGYLYYARQRLTEAEAAYQEALEIRRELAKSNPAAYQPDLAKTLTGVAILYRHTKRKQQAEDAYQEAVVIYRQLVKSNAAKYQFEMSSTLWDLATLYDSSQRQKEAEVAYQEALPLYREMASISPASHQEAMYQEVMQRHVALISWRLANIYSATQRLTEAEAAYQEALSNFRSLKNYSSYQEDVAHTLNQLAGLHVKTGNLTQAGKEIDEAIAIDRERLKADASGAADDLAQSLLTASSAQQDSSAKCKLVREAASFTKDATLKEAADKEMASCPPQ